MRKYEDDFDELVKLTTEMGEHSILMLNDATSALFSGDVDLANKVIEEFENQNQMDDTIEEKAIRILTIYQPTAIDVRTVSTVLKCITYMERIGKYSKNIAKIVEPMAQIKPGKFLPEIEKMTKVSTEMVNIVVNGFENKRIHDFDKLKSLDDELDHLRDSALRNGIDHIKNNSGCTDICMFSISISRYLERIGDHACKMGEKIAYMVTGEHVEIDS